MDPAANTGEQNVSVARVVVDSALPHLDRDFDYLVPVELAETVEVGTRVRVPFAGRLVSAVVTEVPAEATPGLKLAAIKSAAAAPSYTAAGIRLARSVAHRYGGSLWDVLRLMAPPRVASVEKRAWPRARDPESSERIAAALAASAVSDSAAHANAVPEVAERVVWAALPSPDRGVIPAAALVLHSLARIAQHAHDASALLVVPDARALAACERAARAAGLTPWASATGGDFVVLDHDAGTTPRYASYLAALHGEAPLVIGTRPAVLQPVPSLASIVVWDEGSDALLDAHAPYFHARTVAAMRAQEEGAALLLAAYAPSVDAAALVAHGFAQAVAPQKAEARAAAPQVTVADEESRAREGPVGRHWMPSAAWRGLVEAAASDCVAVMVPRAGYVTAIACARCQTWPLCPACEGELMLAAPDAPPSCRDCGAVHADLHCVECSSPRFAPARQGVEAIALQLRRMAPDTAVHISSAATGVLGDLTVDRGMVVATPAALPAVSGGYSRLVVVGADRPAAGGLNAELLALRWWINAAALVRSRAEGGAVVIVGDLLPGVRQAVQSWDPWSAAQDAYAERAELGLPPVRRALRLDGSPRAVEAARRALATVAEAALTPDADGAIVLVSRGSAQAAVDAVREVVVQRSKAGESPLRLRVDAALP